MPVYEYKCVDCLERFEVEQSMSDPTLKRIKGEDHTHNVKKVFSPVGISFKGSGFYKNDSAGKKSSPKASNADTKGTDSSTKTEKKSSEKSSESSATKKSPDAKAAAT